MNNLFITGLIFVLLSSCNSQQTAPLTEQEVHAIMEKFDRGWKTKNATLVDSVLSPSISTLRNQVKHLIVQRWLPQLAPKFTPYKLWNAIILP